MRIFMALFCDAIGGTGCCNGSDASDDQVQNHFCRSFLSGKRPGKAIAQALC